MGATPNSRSPRSGFGSMASHGWRSARRTLSACRSWWSSTGSPCVGARSAKASVAASIRRRSNGRPRRSQLRAMEPDRRAASSANDPNGGPAMTQRRGRRSTKASSASSADTSDRGVPGTARSRSIASRSGSSSSSRMAPSPFQQRSAAASCSFSPLRNATLRTAGDPSASVAGKVIDSKTSSNGGPSRSPHRSADASISRGRDASQSGPPGRPRIQSRLAGTLNPRTAASTQARRSGCRGASRIRA